MAGVLLAAIAGVGEAVAARSDWVDLDQGRMRLHLSRGDDGAVRGGIEIALEAGWHTYWRSPGDVGVPPVFDFSGSRNVAATEIRFPAPARLEQDGLISAIYENSVILPLVIETEDAAAPVSLSVSALLGICREICIPVRAEASVTLAPDDDDALARVTIARGLRGLPKAPEDGRFAVRSVTRETKRLVIELDVPEGASPPVLFAAGPPDLYLPQPELADAAAGRARFTLALDAVKDDDAAGATIDLVAVAAGKAIAQTVTIPAPAAH